MGRAAARAARLVRAGIRVGARVRRGGPRTGGELRPALQLGDGRGEEGRLGGGGVAHAHGLVVGLAAKAAQGEEGEGGGGDVAEGGRDLRVAQAHLEG